MGVSQNSGIPKWMVYNGKPYQNGWFGGTTIFGNTHMMYTLYLLVLGIKWIRWISEHVKIFSMQGNTGGVVRFLDPWISAHRTAQKSRGVEQIGQMNVEWLRLLNYRFLWRSRWFEVPSAISPNRNKWPQNNCICMYTFSFVSGQSSTISQRSLRVFSEWFRDDSTHNHIRFNKTTRPNFSHKHQAGSWLALDEQWKYGEINLCLMTGLSCPMFQKRTFLGILMEKMMMNMIDDVLWNSHCSDAILCWFERWGCFFWPTPWLPRVQDCQISWSFASQRGQAWRKKNGGGRKKWRNLGTTVRQEMEVCRFCSCECVGMFVVYRGTSRPHDQQSTPPYSSRCFFIDNEQIPEV